jgi:hypothetical protein
MSDIQIVGPGQALIDGQPFQFETAEDGYVFDRVNIANGGGSPVTGSPYTFFTGVSATKVYGVDTNIKQASKLPFQQDMAIYRVGLRICSAVGNTEVVPKDIKMALEAGCLECKVNKNVIFGGKMPLVCFPSGVGVAGMTSDSSQGVINNGDPATGLISPALAPQYVQQEQSIDAVLEYLPRTWITSYVIPSIASTVGVLAELTWYGILLTPAFNR